MGNLTFKCLECEEIIVAESWWIDDSCPAQRVNSIDFRHHLELVTDESLYTQDQITEIANIKKLTNGELFDTWLAEATGDDYDGGFTDWVQFRHDELTKELRKRLASWLEE